jgi:methionyl aminopeptidase
MPLEPDALDAFRRAGALISHCREWARDAIKPGVEMRAVLETVEAMIRDGGAEPSFPAQSSRNRIAAHYCTSPTDPLRYAVGDCVKVDIGAHIDGYVVDTACTVDLSKDGRWSKLIGATELALNTVIDTARPGVTMAKLGAVVEAAIRGAGFEPVRNLAGHGVGRWKVHLPPSVPNIANDDETVLEEGMTIAVEPFASTGTGWVLEEGQPEVFMLTGKPRRRFSFDPKLLEAIESWNGLPVARRYFNEFDALSVNSTLERLVNQRVMVAYPPLAEPEPAIIAQTEHTLYISAQGAEVLTA